MQKKVLVLLTLFLCFGMFSHVFAVEKVKKTIVFIKDDDGEAFTGFANYIGSLLPGKGWTNDNSKYITLSLEGKADKSDEIVEKIKAMKPDVVMMNTTQVKPIAMKLKEAGIPCVAGGGLELEDENGKMIFVDKNGFPTTNLTGTYTMPRTHVENSFAFLNRVAPIKGKKAVFATYNSAAFNKFKIEKALKKHGIELKDYQEFKYIEDYRDFLIKYNKDKEVGWVLSGEIILSHKDGRVGSLEEFIRVERENNSKPNIEYWEIAVQNGSLCALAIDSITTVGQMVNIADRIVKGEKVSKIKPEDPAKTLVILNQQRAKEMKLVFPIVVVQGAWKIYTDYEGHSVERK